MKASEGLQEGPSRRGAGCDPRALAAPPPRPCKTPSQRQDSLSMPGIPYPARSKPALSTWMSSLAARAGAGGVLSGVQCLGSPPALAKARRPV